MSTPVRSSTSRTTNIILVTVVFCANYMSSVTIAAPQERPSPESTAFVAFVKSCLSRTVVLEKTLSCVVQDDDPDNSLKIDLIQGKTFRVRSEDFSGTVAVTDIQRVPKIIEWQKEEIQFISVTPVGIWDKITNFLFSNVGRPMHHVVVLTLECGQTRSATIAAQDEFSGVPPEEADAVCNVR